MKKGTLCRWGGGAVLWLGAERLKEKLDDEGMGGLFVPQMRIVIANTEVWVCRRNFPPGKKMWVDSKDVSRV